MRDVDFVERKEGGVGVKKNEKYKKYRKYRKFKLGKGSYLELLEVGAGWEYKKYGKHWNNI